MPYARVIVNPVAGAGKTTRQWPHILALLENIMPDFKYDLTASPGHAVELARSAAKEGCEIVISVGGDGTINEIVNGLHGTDSLDRVALGIISTGTGADYIRTIGIPRAYAEACQRFAHPQKRQVDLGVVEYAANGKAEKRIFVNFAGMGFDAEIVKATTQKYKALGDTGAYLMGLFSTVLLYNNKDVTINVDGEVEKRKVCTVVMNNGKYGGGGMMTAPNADPADGLLDVLIVDDLTKPDLLRSLPRIYKGTHLTHPKICMKLGKEVEIQPEQQMFLQADGEFLGQAPARFSILPSALTVIV